MGEGTHLDAARTSRLNWTYIAGGTAVLLLVGGVMMQIWRAQPSRAAEQPAAGSSKIGTKPASDTVARVNKESISYNMLADECVARHGREVLDDLINRMIIQQACEANGISITDAEIKQEIARIAKRFNLDVESWYQMLEAERNVSRVQYERSIIFPMLALRKLSGEQVALSEDEIVKAFQRNYGPRVKAKIIMLDNLRRANEAWDKVQRDSENFEKYAQEYSIDANSRALGGTVPPIPRHSGNPTLEDKAFKLKPGEISSVIEAAPGRWVILKCEGQTEPVVTSMEQVREQLIAELHEAKTQEGVAKVFENVKKQARVHNLITGIATGPNAPTSALPGTPRETAPIQQTSGSKPAPATTAAPTNRTPR